MTDASSPSPSPHPDDIELFRQLADTGNRSIRNALVERYMGLAAHIAKRFGRAGSEDDLRQAAMIGLVKAVDRFDPDYGVAFATFAGSTIEGELKRYLRDRTWVVRVPRAAKELHLLVRRAVDEFTHANGRTPSVDEIRVHLDISRDDVLRGLAATAAYDVDTLDSSVSRPVDHSTALATHEAGFERALDTDAVRRLLDQLPERERQIVQLRFYDERSQADIAEIIGVSQMHVSRLLRRSFELMRDWMDDDQDNPDSTASSDTEDH